MPRQSGVAVRNLPASKQRQAFREWPWALRSRPAGPVGAWRQAVTMAPEAGPVATNTGLSG
jgi:hypothetical protein